MIVREQMIATITLRQKTAKSSGISYWSFDIAPEMRTRIHEWVGFIIDFPDAPEDGMVVPVRPLGSHER
jgi:hypothetical protein